MTEVVNLILRIEDSMEQPHSELESVGNPEYGIWIKDYDIWPNTDENVYEALWDAVNIAKEITAARKSIHLALSEGDDLFTLEPSLLAAIAGSGCSLELV